MGRCVRPSSRSGDNRASAYFFAERELGAMPGVVRAPAFLTMFRQRALVGRAGLFYLFGHFLNIPLRPTSSLVLEQHWRLDEYCKDSNGDNHVDSAKSLLLSA